MIRLNMHLILSSVLGDPKWAVLKTGTNTGENSISPTKNLAPFFKKQNSAKIPISLIDIKYIYCELIKNIICQG